MRKKEGAGGGECVSAYQESGQSSGAVSSAAIGSHGQKAVFQVYFRFLRLVEMTLSTIKFK